MVPRTKWKCRVSGSEITKNSKTVTAELQTNHRPFWAWLCNTVCTPWSWPCVGPVSYHLLLCSLSEKSPETWNQGGYSEPFHLNHWMFWRGAAGRKGNRETSFRGITVIRERGVLKYFPVRSHFFFFSFWPHCTACGISVLWLGIEPAPLQRKHGVFSVVKILCFHCGDMSSIPGWGTKTPHALWWCQKEKGTCRGAVPSEVLFGSRHIGICWWVELSLRVRENMKVFSKFLVWAVEWMLMPFTETGNLDKGSGVPGKLVDLDISHDKDKMPLLHKKGLNLSGICQCISRL